MDSTGDSYRQNQRRTSKKGPRPSALSVQFRGKKFRKLYENCQKAGRWDEGKIACQVTSRASCHQENCSCTRLYHPTSKLEIIVEENTAL